MEKRFNSIQKFKRCNFISRGLIQGEKTDVHVVQPSQTG